MNIFKKIIYLKDCYLFWLLFRGEFAFGRRKTYEIIDLDVWLEYYNHFKCDWIEGYHRHFFQILPYRAFNSKYQIEIRTDNIYIIAENYIVKFKTTRLNTKFLPLIKKVFEYETYTKTNNYYKKMRNAEF